MRITDRNFIRQYGAWNCQVNAYTAKVLMVAFTKTENLEIKKALFVKIFFELIQTSENLIALVYALKKSGSMRGLKRQIIECPSGGAEFRNLWLELRRYKNHPLKFYACLGIWLSSKQYLKDKAAFDGFAHAVQVAFENRFKGGRKNGNGIPMKAFNKLKHGFSVYTEPGNDTVYFLMKSGRKIRQVPFKCDAQKAHTIVESTRAMQNSLFNFTQIALTWA